MQKIVLCSASPRRRELLSELVDSFEIITRDGKEESKYLRPHKRVMDLALGKQRGIELPPCGALISADTLVYYRGKYFGKPGSPAAAKEMLRELSGKTHFVYTGVAVRTCRETVCFYDRSGVTFFPLSEEDIERYVRDFSPLDKAGAYGIQDGAVVKSYSGSYSNIVGLPMEKLKEVLEKTGVINEL